jgi:hypothetical protein
MSKPNALLLGMVFATEQKAKRGQEYRDRVRCEALENIGYTVRTLDNKHADKDLSKHCTANFSDTRRMMRAMDTKLPGEKFDHVILDYFFSPVRKLQLFPQHFSNTETSFLYLQYFKLYTGWMGKRTLDRSSFHKYFTNFGCIWLPCKRLQNLAS